MTLVGHQHQIETIARFERSSQQKTFLLHGIEGIGKRTTAEHIAALANCRHSYHLETVHEDLKKLKTCDCLSCGRWRAGSETHCLNIDFRNRDHRAIDFVRGIGSLARKKEPGVIQKMVVLDNLQSLPRRTSDVLLKTIEESGIPFFLISSDIDAVTQTIRSRSVEVFFQPLSTQQVKQLALADELYLPEDVLEDLASLSGGSISRLRDFAQSSVLQLKEMLEEDVMEGMNIKLIQDIMTLIRDSSDLKIQKLRLVFLLAFLEEKMFNLLIGRDPLAYLDFSRKKSEVEKKVIFMSWKRNSLYRIDMLLRFWLATVYQVFPPHSPTL